MTTYTERLGFILDNLGRLTYSQLDLIAADCIAAADYSPRHEQRVQRERTYVSYNHDLLRLIWNACTWAGLNPQRQLNEWTAVDLADQMADDEVDTPAWIAPADDARYEDESRSSFDLLLIDRRPMAGDCGPCDNPTDFDVQLHELDLPALWS